MLSRHDATGPRAGKAAGEGRPESEDLPLSARLDALAEGRKEMHRCHVVSPLAATLSLVRRARLVGGRRPARGTAASAVPRHHHGRATARSRSRSGPPRIVSLSPTATESLFAIGAGPPGDRRRRPVRLPEERAEDGAVRVHARTSRRSPRYRPDLVIVAYDPKDLVGGARRSSASRWSSTSRATTIPGAYQQIRQLGARRPGHGRGPTTLVARMKSADRARSSRSASRPADGLRPCTTSSTRASSPRRRTRSSGASTRSSA